MYSSLDAFISTLSVKLEYVFSNADHDSVSTNALLTIFIVT